MQEKTREELLAEIKALHEKIGMFENTSAKQKSERIKLAKALYDAEQRQQEVNALLQCARAVLLNESFEKTAREIFNISCEMTGARSGYVALLSEAGSENEVLFLESGGMDCTVDENLPMPIRGLRSESYRTGKSVYDNDFMNSEWVKFMPAGHVLLENVMFAPLMIEGKAVGLIGLANKKGDFNDNDARLASAFGDIASVALQNSRNLDQLRDALARIKTLRGLLPICASCKKIRDDQGYWNQIEKYIGEHSEADFTHSICPECAKKLYPEIFKDK